jgi:hypothetical protein
MNKYIPLLLLAMVSFLSANPVMAWSVTNHHDIAEDTYYSLPVDMQENLNLSTMVDGSDDPDTKFLDFKYHVYPYNLQKAKYWLNEGKTNYQDGDYNYSSYCYGVATHYISDGLCGPHFESGSSRTYHALYEVRALLLKPKITYYSEDLDSVFQQNHLKTKKSWKSWLKQGDDVNIQNDLDRAGSASYSAVFNSIKG